MNDSDRELAFVRQHLKSALPAWPDDGPARDLWPRMLRRMQEAPATFGWFESALAAGIVAIFAVFPELIPLMLLHL